MAGVLTFSQYLGGPDDLRIEQIFPSNQKTFQYNFGKNITDWTFKLDQQTVVVDTIGYDRDGSPNFANSSVIGYFSYGSITTATYVTVVNTTTGIVNMTIPTNLYTGPILPDARKNVPITIIGVTWTDLGTPPQINTHRWAFIQCYEPGVSPGDPTLDAGYTAIAI